MTRREARQARVTPMPLSRAPRWRCHALWLALLGSSAMAAPAPSSGEPVQNSALDAPMFYQLLVGEMEAQAGRGANAYEVLLDAGRRSRDGALFQRAIDIAVQMRAGDKALAAARAWRSTLPESVEATRTQVQLLVALDKIGDLAEPLKTLLEQLPAEDRSAVIAGVPRFLDNSSDKTRAFNVAEQALSPYLNAPATRVASRTTLGRLALAAGRSEQALSLARRALADDPGAPGPVLLALELMPAEPSAEVLVQASLARPDAPAPIRMAYARTLEQRQRLVEAIAQMRLALQQQPELPQGWLSLGAALLDLHEHRPAVEALQRAMAQLEQPQANTANTEDEDDNPEQLRRQRLRELVWQLMAQAAEQQGDDRASLGWLDRIPAERADLSVQARRAGVLARQGRLDEARRLVREGAAADNPEPRARLLAEAQVLRGVKQWQAAYDLLLAGLRQRPDDTGLMYELAMMAERIDRLDDMEALLRRSLALKPDDPQALNALGYALADRNQRLDEALALVSRAVQLAPTDPFIADSLGWVEFRRGNRAEALRLLRQSYGHRPHVEVAAHLGEVLWVEGQQEEALRVWRDGAAREGDNEVLRETLTRLRVSL